MFLFIVIVTLSLEQVAASVTARPGKLFSYAIPDNRPLKKALGYYEDTYLNFTELTTKYGYSSEQHTVVTEDGYILTIFRILTKCTTIHPYPAIMTHGVYDSSDAWILTGPKTGIGFILSNNCYDVWAVNLRGNVYSRKHVRLDPNKDPDYWEFSVDEISYFDLPAVIDYILDVTGRSQAYYVAHSQGTADFFVMGSLRPEYNDKIRLSIHLAPVAWLRNLKNPLLKIIARESKSIVNILENIGYRELLAKQQLSHVIPEFLCQFFPQTVCGTGLSIATGYIPGSITSKNLAVVMGHIFVGVSLKTVIHFAQWVNSGNFQRFDEGKKVNLIKYGTIKPPQYNVSLVSSPVVLICAENDDLSTLEDVDILSSRLPNLVEKYIVPDPTWSHNNHVWGVKATEYVFSKILTYFNQFNT